MIITRFAPSPTGYLHIGGARTALFNYLFAKNMNGKFLLRIEDTDKERSTKDAIDCIINSMKWLNIDYDDEIVYQSTRAFRHREAALRLIDIGMAYYCFSSQEEIDAQRQDAISNGKSFLFHSPWRDTDPSLYPKDQKPVVRLKVPHNGQTVIHDLVQGDIVVENHHIDDMVLLRSDESPTYMLAVVVDDHDMGITHIIRGDDHLTNAARQIVLYNALDWNIPQMAHIPLIYGQDNTKLSKRHGAISVELYKDAGYLPDAICNYLLRLGWSHGNDEIMSRKDAIAFFNIESIGKSPSRLDFDKLKNLNAHYMREMDNAILTDIVTDILLSNDILVSELSKQNIMRAMPSLKIRASLTTELARNAQIYMDRYDVVLDNEATQILQNTQDTLFHEIVVLIEQLAQNIQNQESTIIQEALKSFAFIKHMKIGDIMKPLRASLTGSASSPSIFELIAILGFDETLARLSKTTNSDILRNSKISIL